MFVGAPTARMRGLAKFKVFLKAFALACGPRVHLILDRDWECHLISSCSKLDEPLYASRSATISSIFQT
jgi:hypothetical protein